MWLYAAQLSAKTFLLSLGKDEGVPSACHDSDGGRRSSQACARSARSMTLARAPLKPEDQPAPLKGIGAEPSSAHTDASGELSAMRKGAARGRRPPTAGSLLRCVYRAALSRSPVCGRACSGAGGYACTATRGLTPASCGVGRYRLDVLIRLGRGGWKDDVGV